MASWNAEELAALESASELEIASLREDGTPRSYRVIWGVRVDDDFYVRSVNGTTAGGDTLVITGTGFGAGGSQAGSVTLNGVSCPVILATYTFTQIQCTTPANMGTAMPVIVTVGGRASNTAYFSSLPPSTTSVLPQGGSTAGGTTRRARCFFLTTSFVSESSTVSTESDEATWARTCGLRGADIAYDGSDVNAVNAIATPTPIVASPATSPDQNDAFVVERL